MNDNDNELFKLLDEIDYEDNNDEKEFDEVIQYDKIYCDKCNTEDHIAEDTANGIISCMKCGTFISEVFDVSPEWKSYVDGKNSSARCNAASNFFLPQSSLGTSIGGTNRSKIKLLHSWYAMPYKERILNNDLKEIQNICRQANILKCIEDDAKIFYKILSECKHVNGKNEGEYIIVRGIKRTSLKGACLYYACKRKGDTRSPKEIAKMFNIKYKNITKGCKTYKKLMKVQQIPYDSHVNNPEHFIKRYCKGLHITQDYVSEIMRIIKNIEKLNLISAHTPPSIALGTIILVIELNNLDIDKTMIAEKFDMSPVTINKAYKKIKQYKKILINDELTDKIAKVINNDKTNIKKPEKLKSVYKNNILPSIPEYNNASYNEIINKFDNVNKEYIELMKKVNNM